MKNDTRSPGDFVKMRDIKGKRNKKSSKFLGI